MALGVQEYFPSLGEHDSCAHGRGKNATPMLETRSETLFIRDHTKTGELSLERCIFIDRSLQAYRHGRLPP